MKTVIKAVSLMILLFSVAINQQKVNAQKWISSEEIEMAVPKSLSNAAYLDSFKTKVSNLIAEGRYFQKDTLIKALAHYKRIAWSKEIYKKSRITYYSLLADNSGIQSKIGEAIYFYEKLEAEKEKQGIPGKSNTTDYQRTLLYVDSRQFAKVIAEFEGKKAYFDSLPLRVKENKNIQISEVLLTFAIMKEVGYCYAILNDTIGMEKLINFTEELLRAVKSKRGSVFLDHEVVTAQFLTYSLHFFKYRHICKDAEKTYELLHQMKMLGNDTSLNNSRKHWIRTSEEYWRMDYYASLKKNADSLRYYLELYNNEPQMSVNSTKDYKVKYYELLLKALESGNTTLLPLIDSLLSEKDSIVLQVSKELEDNLYAQTKAEDMALSLRDAERAKEVRKIAIIVTVLCALLISSLIYIRMRFKNKKIQIQVEQANRIINLKVAEMEEAKSMAVVQEQERLARELHDDFSSTLAGLRQQVELLQTEYLPAVEQTKLAEIESGLNKVYMASRAKSHEWYNDSKLQQQGSFKDTISFLINSVLSDKQYKKHLEISEASVLYLSVDNRINILRIIQESLTNIIKHSKANEVTIFLSDNLDQTILQIADNGVGMGLTGNNKTAVWGMGLRSIDTRVKAMTGSWEIIEEEGSTLITINVPKTSA